MSFDAFRKNKILAKIFEFTVFVSGHWGIIVNDEGDILVI